MTLVVVCYVPLVRKGGSCLRCAALGGSMGDGEPPSVLIRPMAIAGVS